MLYGVTIFLLLDNLHVGAYQIAVLSLLVTMIIGYRLIQPVADRWSGSGEQPFVAPPVVGEHLAPVSVPIEPG
jgi:hypothetical protein